MDRDLLLSPDKDPMGTAMSDYLKDGKAAKLRVFSPQFDEDEIPVAQLFRTEGQLPALERTALQAAKGHILDVGAGSGCHSLVLQDMGKEVTAIDISLLSVDVMRMRGVKDARLANFFSPGFQGQFDTILLLMNGAGIIGRLENMPDFFAKARQLLRKGGCILLDSSDLKYLYEEEDGSMAIDLAGDYYGEIEFRMKYKSIEGAPFTWLYVDFPTLQLYAESCGFTAEILADGKHYDYIAQLKPIE